MNGIINYGMGNLQSVKNSLDYLGIKNKFVNDPLDIQDCDKLILPGVGAFGMAMEKLKSLKFIPYIKEFASLGKPILGLCLGMQLLLDSSEEYGKHTGLGFISGKALSFVGKVGNLAVPHVGWNDIKIMNSKSKLLEGVGNDASCYFVHSFYCSLVNKDETVAVTNYGFEFSSVIESKNIFGCQFHPEKSQVAGLKILKNFDNI